MEFELKHDLLSIAVEVVRTTFFGVEQTLYYNVTKYYVLTDMKLDSLICIYFILFCFFFFNTQQGHWKSVTVGSVENESDIRLTLRFVS